MRKWRKEPKGKGWRLVAGRADDRIRLHLPGVASEADADRALATMQAEEDTGTASRVLALADADPAAAVRYLLGDPASAVLLPKPTPDYPRMPLRVYFDEHYREHRAATRPATWRTEAGHWRRILEGLGDVRLRDLEPRVFLRWVRDLRVERSGGVRRGAARSDDAYVPTGDRSRPASGAYQRLLRSALQGLLTFAYTEGHVDEHVRLGELRIAGSTARAREQVAPLSLDELVRLMGAADEPKLRALFAVAGGLGLRPSEVQRIRWEDVRWATRTLVVRGEKTEQAADEIPLTPIAHRELRAWWVRCAQPTTGTTFPATADGEPYKAASGYKRALSTAADKAGIGRPVSPYLLRHSFATIAWSLGIEQDVARRILRHADAAMLDKVYCRPRPADLVARVAAFDVG